MQHTVKLAAPSAAIALAGLVAFSVPTCGRANPRDDIPAGGLDQRFGYAGIASIPLSPATADRFLAVTVAEDGQTYAAGFVTLGTDQAMAVARIAPDGSLDNSFDGDGIGIVNVAVGGNTAEIARGVAVQSTGKVVVGGPMEQTLPPPATPPGILTSPSHASIPTARSTRPSVKGGPPGSTSAQASSCHPRPP